MFLTKIGTRVAVVLSGLFVVAATLFALGAAQYAADESTGHANTTVPMGTVTIDWDRVTVTQGTRAGVFRPPVQLIVGVVRDNKDKAHSTLQGVRLTKRMAQDL